MRFENENYQHVAKDARKLWTIHACIGAFVVLIITMGVYFIVYKHIWIYVLTALYAIVSIIVMPAVEYRQWRYLIAEDRIEIIHGIFFTKRVLIPINRIQHLKIRQGVLQKRFNLSTVDIYTAGGAHEIEALLYDEADGIVRKLNHLVAEEGLAEDVGLKEAPAKEKEDSHEA